ncbi:MAG: hypothetical protein ICV60_02190 [Pyrinomonadaceae bacterium]|nr:hypothetical protein [Pyrinomonadaceae bacterium]
MTRLEDLRPWQKRILKEVFWELECAVSVPNARLMLEAKSNDNKQLTNPHLQPIVFAVRYATWRNYVYGVIGELFAWALFLFFSLLWLLAALALIAVTLFALFVGQVRAMELPIKTLPGLYEKLKRVRHGFERRRWSAQRRRYNAYQKLCADGRAPILYLRLFSSDQIYELPLEVTRRVDERLAEHYEQYGPVIAVGGPNEKGPMPGPVRLYFDDNTWRAGVIYLMSISRLVIIQAGIAQGVLWELGIARRLLEPEKLIISVADASNPDIADRYYYDFKKCAEVLLDCELPMSLGSSVYIGFGKNWEAFPQDPRVLIDASGGWSTVKYVEKQRTQQTYEEVLKAPAATNHVSA